MTVKMYRAYRNVPTRNSDWLRTTETLTEAEQFYGLYESQFAIAVYTEVPGLAGVEVLAYTTAGLDNPGRLVPPKGWDEDPRDGFPYPA